MNQHEGLRNLSPLVVIAMMRLSMPIERTFIDEVAAWLITDIDFDWEHRWAAHRSTTEEGTRHILEQNGQSCHRPLAELNDLNGLITLRSLKYVQRHICSTTAYMERLLEQPPGGFWFSSGSERYCYDRKNPPPTENFPVYYRCKHEFFIRCKVDPEIQSMLFDTDFEYEDIVNFAALHHDPAGKSDQMELYNYVQFLVYTEWGSMRALHNLIERLNFLLVHFELREEKDPAIRLLEMLDIVLTVAEDCKFPFIFKLPAGRYELPPHEVPIPAAERIFFNIHFRSIHAGELTKKYIATGNMDHLEWAMAIQQQLIRLLPRENFNLAVKLCDFSTMLKLQFEQHRCPEWLDRAIYFVNEALRLESTRNDAQDGLPLYLDRLGDLLGYRFNVTGDMTDLDRAIRTTARAVEAAKDLETRNGYLHNHARWLAKKYERTQILKILDSAIDAAERVVAFASEDYDRRTNGLHSLGGYLALRFVRRERKEDIDRAIELCTEAAERTHEDHTDRTSVLGTLASNFGARAKKIWPGWREDLDQAIEISQKALHGSTIRKDRDRILTNLTQFQGLRSLLDAQFGISSVESFDAIIETARLALDSTPQESPDRAVRLFQLGMYLGQRFELTKVDEDAVEVLTHWKEALDWKTAPPSLRVRTAYRLGEFLSSQKRWSEACLYFDKAVELLPLVSGWTMENNDKQDAFEHSAGLASSAAAIALQAGKGDHAALKVLEMGRCVIAGLLLEIRSDMTMLKEQHPALATEFEALRNKLDAPIRESSAAQSLTDNPIDQVEQRGESSKRLNELIVEIRSHLGFETFLLPPAIGELQAAADLGPVVIVNVSTYRCDAFLIERHQISVLPLTQLTEHDAKKIASERLTIDTLRWLWRTVTAPVLAKLGYVGQSPGTNLPRVWWIPTGPLSQLPLHAAGIYDTDSNETVLDRVMSSYASSVKALIYGRKQKIHISMSSDQDLALLVSMQHTPNLSRNMDLPFAAKEVECVAQLIKSLKLDPVTPLPKKENVLAKLGVCRIFHFAGHGEPDSRDPSKSRLLLEDWEDSPLTVGDLQEHKIQQNPPFLGYLSACSTASNKVDRLVDEGIHLVSAFQLAGFRHVIGTLWAVSDSHCVDVARIVYETLRDEGLTDLAVCRGLHRAVSFLRLSTSYVKMRARDVELLDDEEEEHKVVLGDPMLWAPYIHYGV